MDKIKSAVTNKFDVLWQSALVKLPRVVPTAVLKYTSPLGPQPFILDLPSRDYDKTKRTIPVYVFVPPLEDNDPYYGTAANLSSISVNSTKSTASRASKASKASKSSKTSKASKKSKASEINQDEDMLNVPHVDTAVPGSQNAVSRTLPVIIDFHGGGFFMGSPLEQAPFCAQMARNLSCVVISVDYRMGPIDKFPTAIHDAEDILNQVLEPRPRPKTQHHSDSYTGSWRSPESQLPAGAGLIDLQNTISYKVNETIFKNRKGGKAPRPLKIKLDRNRVAVCGFSSGGNIALNMALDVPNATPHVPAHEEPWLCPFSAMTTDRPATGSTVASTASTHLAPSDAERPRIHSPSASQESLNMNRLTSFASTQPRDQPHAQIPVLLFYPSLDLRLLPSQRSRPASLGPHPEKGPSWWSRVNDTLAPSYCPLEQTDHYRASPGLASPARDIHPNAKMLLVLCSKDTLAEQSDVWVSKVEAEGRGKDLRVERYDEKHGWTQMPESWLNAAEKRTRSEVFEKTEAFVRACWEGGDAVGRVAEVEGAMREKTEAAERLGVEPAAGNGGETEQEKTEA